MSIVSSPPSNAAAGLAPDLARPPGLLRETLSAAQAAGVDDPDVLRQCQVGAREADGSVPVGLGLSGLYCAACALTIEAAIAKVPGVRNVQVQGAMQRARLVLDPSRSALSDVIRAVQAVGYRAWPDAGSRALGERRQAQRHLLWRLLVAWFCMMQIMMISTAQYVAGPQDIPPDLWNLLNWSAWVLSLPLMFFSCRPFFSGAWAAVKAGRIAMDTPVALGILAMFGVSTGVTFGHTGWLGGDVYFDSLSMFVAFLLTGRWLESRAREKVTQSLELLGGRLPEAVERARDAGVPDEALGSADTASVALSALRAGDRVRVAVGQAFPADGQVIWGQTEVDEALLTGESRPVPRRAGQLVVAGSMNLGSPVWCRVERLGPDTRYQQIVSLVHQALTEKPGWMRAADRFAGPFLWAVLLVAAVSGLAWMWIDASRALWVAVSVLVVTCPCALSLSAPSALLAAADALARSGVLVRRLDAIETLARIRLALFDKTGTLTDPHLQVAAAWWKGQCTPVAAVPDAGVLRAATLAAQSQHPVSRAVASLAEGRGGLRDAGWHSVREVAGQGVEAVDAHGVTWRLGSAAWALGPAGCLERARQWPAGRVWLAPQNMVDPAEGVVGFSFDERPRPQAGVALRSLRAAGVEVAVLSGDHPERVARLVDQLSLQPPLAVAGAAATPEDKLSVLQTGVAAGQGPEIAVVGDGINDAPMLARAPVSFALDQGAALAQSQADFIVLGGRLEAIPGAVHTSRKAMQVVRQNLLWSAAYNFTCIPLAVMGYLPPWLAGLGMALSSLGVVLNALRVGASPASSAAE